MPGIISGFPVYKKLVPNFKVDFKTWFTKTVKYVPIINSLSKSNQFSKEEDTSYS